MKKFMVLVTSLSLAIVVLTMSTKSTSNSLLGVGRGFKGDIRVEVIADNGEIMKINIVNHTDTPEIFNSAFKEITTLIVDTQSTNIDFVAGATASSRGLIEAINNALSIETLDRVAETQPKKIDTVAGATSSENDEKKRDKIVAGEYKGIYWRGASKGVTLADATQKIETVLVVNENGLIEDVKMDFLVFKGEKWISRTDPNAKVNIDYSVDPEASIPGKNYKKGKSMFDIETNDMMSFYAAGVNSDGVVAVALVDPVIRYQFEVKLDPKFDYNTKLENLTVNNGLIPTVRTSGSGIIKPENWEEVNKNHLFDLSVWSHVITKRGIFQKLNKESTVKDLLLSLGIEFKNGIPKEMDPIHGFHSNGGWEGNYKSIANHLIGKDPREITSLIDWSIPKLEKGINKNNFFGVDTVAGATRTAQDSVDGIAGATVRLSRESASYQLALVEAGVISEDEVIKGRF